MSGPALLGTCPVCKNDVATGIDYRRAADPLAGGFRQILPHGAPPCSGAGRTVPFRTTRFEESDA